nr:dihydropteroate synthase [Lachnospiraceae bacterium]
AREQEEKGASVLDINMGTSGIDEKEMMLRAIEEVTYTSDLPLCIDTSHPNIMEAALRRYPGRALINSISAEMPKRDELLSVAKRYGAMYILLPLSEAGLPKNIEEKHANIHTVLNAASEFGLGREDAVVDLLVATVGADKKAAINCFTTLSYCKEELKLPTICGLSNISFGLPQRPFVNTAFLTIAISKGLTMAIANPSQDLLLYTAFAADMLIDKEGAPERYLELPEAELSSKTGGGSSGDKTRTKVSKVHPVFDCVLSGDKEKIEEEVKKELDLGTPPKEILDTYLIAAINEVGRLYDEKQFFLPQLMAGAAAMERAVSLLEPLLASGGAEEKETVVIATVEGDIHDIGKNLVALMLKNYGYRVIDLGKDVPAETIVDRAIEENADVIGLSALMTTTMMQMKNVVELAKERGCKSKIVIGGACITDDFATEIGADGYSEDASECVRLVKKLLNREIR